MIIDPKYLTEFARIIDDLQNQIKESNAHLASPAGRRQMRKFAHFPNAPLAVTITARDARILMEVYSAIVADQGETT